MPSRRLTILPQAELDIADLAAYIAADNPVAARSFGDELNAKLEQIAEMPGFGFRVHGATTALRATRVSKRFWRYLVFYREVGDDALEIIRVLHASRDLNRILRAAR
jgi:plasmid stabilization system protein ParE